MDAGISLQLSSLMLTWVVPETHSSFDQASTKVCFRLVTAFIGMGWNMSLPS